MKTGTIYALCCPETGSKRYVGQTTSNLTVRLKRHLTFISIPQIKEWVSSLSEAPIIISLEENVPIDMLNERESYWLGKFTGLLNKQTTGHINRKLAHKGVEIIRYAAIDRRLRDTSLTPPKLSDLITAVSEECSSTVSKRTIQQDIEDMRSSRILGLLAPIKYIRPEGNYSYSDPNYNIYVALERRFCPALKQRQN